MTSLENILVQIILNQEMDAMGHISNYFMNNLFISSYLLVTAHTHVHCSKFYRN